MTDTTSKIALENCSCGCLQHDHSQLMKNDLSNIFAIGSVALASLIWLVLSGCSTGPAVTSVTEKKPVASVTQKEAASAFTQQVRAMWLWDETPGARSILENVDGAQDELLEFMRAPHGHSSRSINRIFFEARDHAEIDRLAALRRVSYDPIGDEDERPKLRAFLKRAHAQGAQVEYLDGQAIWLATDRYAQVPKTICRDVVAFNLSTEDRGERFDGVHLDIEPHTVTKGPFEGRWWQDRLEAGYNREWTARWKGILDSCRSTFDAYETETGHHLTLAADVGADFAHYNKPMLAFLDSTEAPTDYVVIMNYYDNRPNRDDKPSFFHGASNGDIVVGGVIQNLALWTTTPLMFGLETGPPKIAPNPRSFHQEGHTALYDTIDELVDTYGSTGCVGAAIHHYGPDAYKDLAP
jgi:hypothetical protein